MCAGVVLLFCQEFSHWVYFSYASLGLAIGMAQGILYIYLPELFPPNVRGKSVGICPNSGRILTACVVLFSGMMIPLIGGYLHAIFFFSMAYLVGIATIGWDSIYKLRKKLQVD